MRILVWIKNELHSALIDIDTALMTSFLRSQVLRQPLFAKDLSLSWKEATPSTEIKLNSLKPLSATGQDI